MSKPRPVNVSILRLNVLRAYYALMAFGTMALFWPDLISHTNAWGVDTGAQYSLLAALSPLSLLGIRYPLKMIPVILFEFLWKALWLVFVVVPLWSNDAMTENIWANVFAVSIAIILTPIVLPWRYVLNQYAHAAAEPWTATKTRTTD